jgi:CRISPR-associated protein Cmr1
MHKVTLEVRTLTPLFLAGADQGRAELRAPTVRGLLRYWRRALIGGLVGTDAAGLKQVQQMESATFGTTERGSAVIIRVSGASQEPREFTEKISMRQGEKWLATGKGYLLWSMARSGNAKRGNFKPARWYFPAGTSFQVTLAARDAASQQIKHATAAFWLLTQLGGLGSRSRRCAGSFSAQAISTTLPDLPHFPFEQAEQALALKQQLEQGIETARACHDLTARVIKEAHFDSLARATCRIWILQDEQPWQSAESAMKVIGERMQEYRNQISIEQRIIFGLPLPPILFNKRRASPLHLRITELRNSTYVVVAVLFKTSGDDVQIKDYAVIEQWIDVFPEKLEVRL